MHETSDAQLLRAYAADGNEAAFRELVTRHTDFVFSAAVRQVDSPDLACDIAQSVFTDLARKARPLAEKISPASSLAGWLHRSTRYAALNHLRDTRRRLANERQAMEQLLTDSESPVNWEQIRPALDEALDCLGDEDREALLLRYFKNQDFRAVGLALGMSDDAAQKRVTRAVERLREFFVKRGVTVGASGLVVVISANAVQAAPVGLAVTISTAAAITGTTLATTATTTAVKTIAMTTLQKTLVTATVAVLAGAGIYEARQTSQLRDQVQTLQQQQAPWAEQIQQLQSEHDDATNRLAALITKAAGPLNTKNELLRLRGEIGMLQNQVGEASKRALAAETKLQAALSAQVQFQSHQVAVVNATKLLGLALRTFMGENENQYPTNILQLNKELGGKFSIGEIDLFSLEFITNNTTGQEPPNAVKFRERLARQATDGTWQRIYGFADGSVQTATSHDGNFDAWEKVNTFSPSTDSNQ